MSNDDESAHPLHRRHRNHQRSVRAAVPRTRPRRDRPQSRLGAPSRCPTGVRELVADVRDADSVARRVGDAEFDVVAEFLAFTPGARRSRHRRCSRGGPGSTSSSAPPRPTRSRRSGCRSPSRRRCATRSGSTRATRSPARTCWSAAYRERGFPVTIVRPSHTYDERLIPTHRAAGPTSPGCARASPVVVHGDGTSLWTITHSDDFAVAFVGPARQPRGDRRGLHHHRHARADLEPDLRMARRMPRA